MFSRPAMHFIADEKLFKSKYFRWLAKMFNAFPVRKQSKNLNVVKYVINRVNAGDGIIWYPEGQRHKNPSINSTNPGKLGSGMPSKIFGTLMVDEGSHSIYPQRILQLSVTYLCRLQNPALWIPPLIPITSRTH